MTVLDRVRGWLAGAETRLSPWAGALPGGYILGSGGIGQGVAPIAAENVSSVLACTNVVSTAIASLPTRVYRSDGNGRIEAPTHPVSRLIAMPNEHQSWCDFIEWMVAGMLLRGNALAQIVYDGAGRPIELRPCAWHAVTPIILPSGRLAFDRVPGLPSPWPDMPGRLLASECVFLRDRSDDGVLGRSRLSRCPAPVLNALAEAAYTDATWQNQATPRGALKFDQTLSVSQFERIRAQFGQRHSGTANAGETLILDSGASWQAFSFSPEDAQLLESRKFTVEEICRLFQVPPPLVQDYSRNTFTNASTAGIWFAQFTLAPIIRKVELEFQRSVFGAGSPFSLTVDMTMLTRGDVGARWASYAVARQFGILTTDEIREQEGFGPMPAGARDVTPSRGQPGGAEQADAPV